MGGDNIPSGMKRAQRGTHVQAVLPAGWVAIASAAQAASSRLESPIVSLSYQTANTNERVLLALHSYLAHILCVQNGSTNVKSGLQ